MNIIEIEDTQNDQLGSGIMQQKKEDMIKLQYSQDNQLAFEKPDYFQRDNPQYNLTDDLIFQPFSQEYRARNANELYARLNCGFSSPSEEDDPDEHECDCPSQINFEGMNYIKGLTRKDHTLFEKHFYYCHDKGRINCQSRLVYNSKNKFIKLITPHNKALSEHQLHKIETAIKFRRNRTVEGFISEYDIKEIDEIISKLLIQNRHVTVSNLKIFLSSKIAINQTLPSDQDLNQRLNEIYKKLYNSKDQICEISTLTCDDFGKPPLLFYNNTTRKAEKAYVFYSNPFQTHLIETNKTLQKYQIDLLSKAAPEGFETVLIISIQDMQTRSPICVYFALLETKTKDSLVEVFKSFKKNMKPDPALIVSPYEATVLSALAEAFPQCVVKTCYFNYVKSIWKLACKFGLKEQSLVNRTRGLINYLKVLSLVKEEKIRNNYDKKKKKIFECPQDENSRKYKDFLMEYEKTFMATNVERQVRRSHINCFSMKSWNFYDYTKNLKENALINSYAERMTFTQLKFFCYKTKTLDSFIKAIQECEFSMKEFYEKESKNLQSNQRDILPKNLYDKKWAKRVGTETVFMIRYFGLGKDFLRKFRTEEDLFYISEDEDAEELKQKEKPEPIKSVSRNVNPEDNVRTEAQERSKASFPRKRWYRNNAYSGRGRYRGYGRRNWYNRGYKNNRYGYKYNKGPRNWKRNNNFKDNKIPKVSPKDESSSESNPREEKVIIEEKSLPKKIEVHTIETQDDMSQVVKQKAPEKIQPESISDDKSEACSESKEENSQDSFKRRRYKKDELLQEARKESPKPIAKTLTPMEKIRKVLKEYNCEDFIKILQEDNITDEKALRMNIKELKKLGLPAQPSRQIFQVLHSDKPVNPTPKPICINTQESIAQNLNSYQYTEQPKPNAKHKTLKLQKESMHKINTPLERLKSQSQIRREKFKERMGFTKQKRKRYNKQEIKIITSYKLDSCLKKAEGLKMKKKIDFREKVRKSLQKDCTAKSRPRKRKACLNPENEDEAVSLKCFSENSNCEANKDKNQESQFLSGPDYSKTTRVVKDEEEYDTQNEYDDKHHSQSSHLEEEKSVKMSDVEEDTFLPAKSTINTQGSDNEPKIQPIVPKIEESTQGKHPGFYSESSTQSNQLNQNKLKSFENLINQTCSETENFQNQKSYLNNIGTKVTTCETKINSSNSGTQIKSTKQSVFKTKRHLKAHSPKKLTPLQPSPVPAKPALTLNNSATKPSQSCAPSQKQQPLETPHVAQSQEDSDKISKYSYDNSQSTQTGRKTQSLTAKLKLSKELEQMNNKGEPSDRLKAVMKSLITKLRVQDKGNTSEDRMKKYRRPYHQNFAQGEEKKYDPKQKAANRFRNKNRTKATVKVKHTLKIKE
ncbi:unnamed protein product [Moneuplotes crassus]|uniref:Uncharacterized protein n=1 Tax=Euplotes crassus TaxID=5936 RepID=A0AAD1UCI9_EUPCR|nr:unnamed protein product [Moneuplotes crassus]